jgi:hypothetical protein
MSRNHSRMRERSANACQVPGSLFPCNHRHSSVGNDCHRTQRSLERYHVCAVGGNVHHKGRRAAFIEAEDLTITFVSVVEDSRCPIDVRCTWEGNTRIVITLSKNKNKSASIELNTSRLFAREGRYLDYRIGLVKLDPDRTSTREIAEHEYRASLILSKA